MKFGRYLRSKLIDYEKKLRFYQKKVSSLKKILRDDKNGKNNAK